jgi:hypothetical protein
MSERIPWKESNLAAIGSDLDHKIKAAAAALEEQWKETAVGEASDHSRLSAVYEYNNLSRSPTHTLSR